MTRGVKAAALAPGAVYGCWTVVRESTPDVYGRARYLVRGACCGLHVVKYRHDLVKASMACARCACRRKPRSAVRAPTL